MSEIKGQLLGVVLVLILFGTLSGVLTTVFSDLTGKVETQAGAAGEQLVPSGRVVVDNTTSDLLTY